VATLINQNICAILGQDHGEVFDMDNEEPNRRKKRPMGGRKRKRGAQPENQHPTRHGLYARYFNPTDEEWEEAEKAVGLEEEIEMLRMMMWKAFGMAGEGEDWAEQKRLLDAFGMASSRLASVVKIHLALEEGREDPGLVEWAEERERRS